MDKFTIAWIFWLLYFLVVEFDAILSNDIPGTLSEHIFAWFCMKGQRGKFAHLRRVVLLCFMAWLSAHMVTGGKF